MNNSMDTARTPVPGRGPQDVTQPEASTLAFPAPRQHGQAEGESRATAPASIAEASGLPAGEVPGAPASLEESIETAQPMYVSAPAEGGPALGGASVLDEVPPVREAERISSTALASEAPPASDHPAQGAVSVNHSRIRRLLALRVPLGVVLGVTLLTLALVGLSFTLLYQRLGKIDERMQGGFVHAEKHVASKVRGLQKNLHAMQSELKATQAKLPDAAMRLQIEKTATTVAAIEAQLALFAEPEPEPAAAAAAPAARPTR